MHCNPSIYYYSIENLSFPINISTFFIREVIKNMFFSLFSLQLFMFYTVLYMYTFGRVFYTLEMLLVNKLTDRSMDDRPDRH